MSLTKEALMKGEFELSDKIIDMFKANNDTEVLAIKSIWETIWHNYLRENTTDTITISKMMDIKRFNRLLMLLSKIGLIESVVDGNYAYVQFNESILKEYLTDEEILKVKFNYKVKKYILKNEHSSINNLVKFSDGEIAESGLVREGFCKASNNEFKYDVVRLEKYLTYIASNIKKGLEATQKDISYQEIVDSLLQFYLDTDNKYTLNHLLIDSRGRSNFTANKRILNPVSSKDARALMIMEPHTINAHDFNHIYACIAELLGYKAKNYADKIEMGQSAYILRTLPNLQDMVDSDDYSDLHVLIWLERIYENLDNYEYTGWYVPVEIDATASVSQFMAILTNDHTVMDYTNLINPDEFKDFWTVEGLPRDHIKKAVTPRLYGSSAQPNELWDKHHKVYSQEQLNKVNDELRKGRFSKLNQFKNFIIDSVKPKKIMKVKIFNEEFLIKCNRFKWDEVCKEEYYFYTSSQGIMKKVTHEVQRVPDLKQFKRFFVTLLIHNLDSQVANAICEKVDWIIPNHDAFTISPSDVDKVRNLYAELMMNIYKNRKSILHTYFQSIGIKEDWDDNNTEIDTLSGMALK